MAFDTVPVLVDRRYAAQVALGLIILDPGPCESEARPRVAVGAPGVDPWGVYHFPDQAERAAFVAIWQHDLELRLP